MTIRNRLAQVLDRYGIRNQDLLNDLIAAAKPEQVDSAEVLAVIAAFSEAAHILPPEPKSPSDYKLYNKRWLTPVKELVRQANGSSCAVMAAAVQKMRADHLTLYCPESVLAVALSILGESQSVSVGAMSGMEAWGLVQRKVNEYREQGYDSAAWCPVPEFENERLSMAVETIGWGEIFAPDNASVTRAHFVRAYEGK